MRLQVRACLQAIACLQAAEGARSDPACADLEFLNHWDTFNNKLEGDMPSSIQKLGSLDYLYIQNEHSDALRNYYCQVRTPNYSQY